MDNFKILEVKESIFESNDRDAERLRAELREKGVFLLNLMSSPGSGTSCASESWRPISTPTSTPAQ